MQNLSDKVAVITGGASGIGYAMAERFLAEGMLVMLADVEEPALKQAVANLTDAAMASRPSGVAPDSTVVAGVKCDVRVWEDVANLKDETLRHFGAVHVVCNNAGVGSGSHGWMWEYDLNDWIWAMGVNVMGVVHGINAFVPQILHQKEGGHIVNTSSGNGGISPLPGTPIYAASKGAVTLITECLQAQLIEASDSVRASVLYPGPNWLNTKIWSSHRNRPADLVQKNPRTEWNTFEDLRQKFQDSGLPFETTPLEQVAEMALMGIKNQQFWLLPESERADTSIKARSGSMLKRSNPDYFGDWQPPKTTPATPAAPAASATSPASN